MNTWDANTVSRLWRAGAFAALALVGVSCADRAPLPVLGLVPEFQLTSQTGAPLSRKDLYGKIWVADFIFTNCTGPCPMMSSQMGRLQKATSDLADLRLVSFSVDPERDTPTVLAAYGKHFLAKPGRWFFLTGARSDLNDLGLNAFHLNAVDGSLIHSTRFALMDRQSRIRGYYSTGDDDFMSRLESDIRRLERERS